MISQNQDRHLNFPICDRICVKNAPNQVNNQEFRYIWGSCDHCERKASWCSYPQLKVSDRYSRVTCIKLDASTSIMKGFLESSRKKMGHNGSPWTIICHHHHLSLFLSFSIWSSIASMRLSSHALRCETRHWGTSDESGQLWTLCRKEVRESEYHTLIQCSAFDNIQPFFPHIFCPNPILTLISLITKMCHDLNLWPDNIGV